MNRVPAPPPSAARPSAPPFARLFLALWPGPAALRALARYCPSTALALAMHTHVTAAAAWRWKHQKAPTDAIRRGPNA